jgi:hypothetical protein
MLLGVLRSFHPAGCISDVPKLASLERNSSTKLFSVAFLMLLALSPFSTSPFRSAFSSWTIYISYSLLASTIKVRGELFFISFFGLFLLLMDIYDTSGLHRRNFLGSVSYFSAQVLAIWRIHLVSLIPNPLTLPLRKSVPHPFQFGWT